MANNKLIALQIMLHAMDDVDIFTVIIMFGNYMGFSGVMLWATRSMSDMHMTRKCILE